VVFIRTRTTYTTTPANIAVNSYFDWQQIVMLYDFREVVYQIAQNPPFNNNPGGTMASVDVAASFKDEVLREALLFESQGAFQNVKVNAKKFVVQVSSTGRFDFIIPCEVIPGLMVIAGNIQGVVSASVFTL
jgi:phage tail sheath gpL-like